MPYPAKQYGKTLDLGSLLELLDLQLENELNQFISDSQTLVETWRKQGLSDSVILQKLKDEFKERSGLFTNLKGRLGTISDFGMSQAGQGGALEVVSGQADFFQWQWEPGAEHCSTCGERNGQVRTYAEWEGVGLPGQFFASGGIGTVCGHYCKCMLIPIQRNTP